MSRLERHAHRRHDPRHADGRRRRVEPTGRRRRPPRRRVAASRRSTPRTSKAPWPSREHLIELGHRRIGFLAGRPDLESARRREAGYRDGARRPPASPSIPTSCPSGASPRRPPRRRHASCCTIADRPTAIFAANDLSAIQTMRTAAELGIDVPDDLSVVGFDNIPESALTDPPLTTVDQSIQALGHEAVRIAHRLDRAPRAPSRRRPDPRHAAHQLVVRRSSAAPTVLRPARTSAPSTTRTCNRLQTTPTRSTDPDHIQQGGSDLDHETSPTGGGGRSRS